MAYFVNTITNGIFRLFINMNPSNDGQMTSLSTLTYQDVAFINETMFYILFKNLSANNYILRQKDYLGLNIKNFIPNLTYP